MNVSGVAALPLSVRILPWIKDAWITDEWITDASITGRS